MGDDSTGALFGGVVWLTTVIYPPDAVNVYFVELVSKLYACVPAGSVMFNLAVIPLAASEEPRL